MTFKAVFTTDNVAEGEKIEIVVSMYINMVGEVSYRIVQRGAKLPDGMVYHTEHTRKTAIAKAMEYIEKIEEMQT